MEIGRINEIHTQILDIYRKDLLQIVEKYFNNEENSSKEKRSKEFTTTLVTRADLEINNLLIEKLPNLLEDSVVISEESDFKSLSRYTFIVDPIDGTHAFASNLDDWGISIALYEGSNAIYSIIFYPNCKTEYYYAIKGLGAFDPSGKVNFHSFFKFKPAFMCAPSSRKIGRALIEYTKGKQVQFRAYGSAVYAGYTIFRGGTDFIVFDSLNVWDVLGCVFIAEEAGLTTKWFGAKPDFDSNADITLTKCTLLIYKPDFDKDLLADIIKVIESEI
jgi:myo-inositol-1(or 4)-monophosphatase